jgi:hypothetical protein
MNKMVFVVATGILVSACIGDKPAVPVGGTPASVSVCGHSLNEASAIAQKHCEKYGKNAELNKILGQCSIRGEGITMSNPISINYRCVK